MDPNRYLNKDELIIQLADAKSIFDHAAQHVRDMQPMPLRSWRRIYGVFFGKNADSFMKTLSILLDQSFSFYVDSWDEKNGTIFIEGGFGNPDGDIGHLDTCLNTLTYLAGFKNALQYTEDGYYRQSYTWKLKIPVSKQVIAEKDLWCIEQEEIKAKQKLQKISQQKEKILENLSGIYEKKSSLTRKLNPVAAENPKPAKKVAWASTSE